MRISKISILIISLLVVGCGAALEHIRVPGKLMGWKVGFQERERFTNNNIKEIIPASESIHNWSKMVTFQYKDKRKDNPEKFMQALKLSMKNKCKNTKWEILEKISNSILYEWSINGCSPLQDQHELSKLILGNDGLHRVAYTEKVKSMPKDTRAKWIKKLSNAYLAKDGKKVEL